MKVLDINQALLLLGNEVDNAARTLSDVPGFASVKISARFKDEDGRKGVDIVLDSEGNVAVQPQSYGPGPAEKIGTRRSS